MTNHLKHQIRDVEYPLLDIKYSNPLTDGQAFSGNASILPASEIRSKFHPTGNNAKLIVDIPTSEAKSGLHEQSKDGTI